MNKLYLILHKVRGEPAFDIAEKIMIGDEEGWIIPTSGHRAYPLSHEPVGYRGYMQEALGSADWDSLPDHYDAKRDEGPTIDHLRSVLGFRPKPVNNYRRR